MKTEKLENLPFIKYCIRRINLLRQYDIHPIMVFDGAYLPTKSVTEEERRARKETYLQKGKALMKEGKRSEALDCFQRCVEVTPEMALALIKELRAMNIEYIVAPYEADAQLAFLVKETIVDVVITEDSDLLAFGCKRVLFKLDECGNGKLIELHELGRASDSLIGFNPDSFRQMCILSGCDYLSSVPGIGLATACKMMKKFNQDPFRVIKNLQYTTGKVPSSYEEDFRKAEYTFLYQLVFDPRTQQQVRLNEPPPGLDLRGLGFAGELSSPRKAVSMARGNVNPITYEVMDSYSPSKVEPLKPSKSNSWAASAMGSSHKPYPLAGQSSLMNFVSSKKSRSSFKPPRSVQPEDSSLDDDELKAVYCPSSALVEESMVESRGAVEAILKPKSIVGSNSITVSRYFARRVSEPPLPMSSHGSHQESHEVTSSQPSALQMLYHASPSTNTSPFFGTNEEVIASEEPIQSDNDGSICSVPESPGSLFEVKTTFCGNSETKNSSHCDNVTKTPLSISKKRLSFLRESFSFSKKQKETDQLESRCGQQQENGFDAACSVSLEVAQKKESISCLDLMSHPRQILEPVNTEASSNPHSNAASCTDAVDISMAPPDHCNEPSKHNRHMTQSSEFITKRLMDSCFSEESPYSMTKEVHCSSGTENNSSMVAWSSASSARFQTPTQRIGLQKGSRSRRIKSGFNPPKSLCVSLKQPTISDLTKFQYTRKPRMSL